MNHLHLFFTVLILLGTLTCAPAPPFRSPQHIFQLFARTLYPTDETQQARSILTLKYLFRSPKWSPRDRWIRIDDFLRTGGLNSGFRTQDQVLIDNALSHLAEGTLYQDPALLRPSVDMLVHNHFKVAKEEFRFNKEDLLKEPPNLGLTGRGAQGRVELDVFEGVPRPMTVQQAERLVGDGWKKGGGAGGSGGEQQRVHGLESMF